MNRFLLLSLATLWANACVVGQPAKVDPRDLLQAGPMLGYSDMREVMIWAQTKTRADVQVKYWDVESPAPVLETQSITTSGENAFTAHLLAYEVMPGKRYEYKLYINGEAVEFGYPLTFISAPDWSFKSDPPTFSVAVGSCLYINDEPFDRKGKPYGGDYQILSSIHAQEPDLMIWLGDNTYYREADWGTRTGMNYRNTHTRSTPELQPLLAGTHHYATWDDHDYGPNDHNRSFVHKDLSLEVFKNFWANPNYGFLDEACAVTQWTWGDVDFYLLDDRWFRSANDLKANDISYFGQKQVDWLIENLKASRANFKVIGTGGQVLNPAKVYENYANYEEERAYLLQRIQEEGITGVLFLSGDRHHTELTELPREGTYPLRDLTVSPLTSSSHVAKDEGNLFQVPGTQVADRNFAMLTFDGKWGARTLTIAVYDANGKEQWVKNYALTDFKPTKE
ncbi:MAG: alkaline phosphatase family protein [Bacteroidetes bacterium]|nr:alkaline phosphatase family protein [Bacteroidota bacterium]